MGKSIKENTIYNAVRTASTIIFPLITLPYVNRVLLPDNVGKVDFARSFISYFSLISTLGIFTYGIRECARVKDDKKKLSDIASQLFSINLITTGLAYILMLIILMLTSRFAEYKSLILLYSTTLVFNCLGVEWLNSAMEDFKYITIRSIFFQVLSLILMFTLVLKESDYVFYALILVIATNGASIINIHYRRRFCKIKFTLKIDWKKHFLPILYLFVMTLSQVIFNNADITMLGIMNGDYEVGLYSTAHKIVNMVATVVSSVGIVVMPRLSYYFAEKDFDKANGILNKLLGLNIGVGFPCFTGVIMLANEIAWLVGGDEFSNAASIIRILMIGFIFSLVGGSFLGNAVLIATNKEKYYMIVCCITAIVNIIVNSFLIPVFGGNGAAIATALSSLTILILLLFKVDKNVKISDIKTIFLGPIIGSLGIVLCCLLASILRNLYIRTVVSVITSIIVYGVIQVFLKNKYVMEFVNPIFKHFIKKGNINDSV